MYTVTKAQVFGDDLDSAFSRSLDFIGELKTVISKGDAVLVKPNFNTAHPFPGSTDLPFLKIALEKILEMEPDCVTIIESSSIGSSSTRDVMEKIGVQSLTKELGIEVQTEKELEWEKVDLQSLGARYLKKASIAKPALKPNGGEKLILLPCCKTHFVAGFTGALKLNVGLLKPRERIMFHLITKRLTMKVQEKVAELNLPINPDLIVMDARKCFVTKGPANGKVVEPQLILASKDMVAIDAIGIELIQSYGEKNKLSKYSDPFLVPQIKRAAELGLGAKSMEEVKVQTC